jgi:hypothetical protein
MILMNLFPSMKFTLRIEAASRSPILLNMYQSSQCHTATSPNHLVTLGYAGLGYFGFGGG